MNQYALVIGAAALLAVALGIGTARAESEAEMARMHAACHSGDRGACEHFGSALRAEHEHESEWRRMHADWYDEHR
jgi:hypothetical protein